MMIAHHGYNNPVCDAHKHVGAHYTQQNTVRFQEERWRLRGVIVTDQEVGTVGLGRDDVPGVCPGGQCAQYSVR